MHVDADSALYPTLPEADEGAWLADFHAGRRAALERCYRECYPTVHRAVGRVLGGADQESVVHEVFYRVLSREELRRGFQGGSLKAWLATVAVHLATDHVRRQQRERAAIATAHAEAAAEGPSCTGPEGTPEAHEARALIERFQREVLPRKWAPVFEARFLRQLSQREAARELAMHRTTLAYQELRIRALLGRFAQQLRREP
jgi:RNA polymerase sigma-70 factor, ECF subfamily